MDRIGLIAGNGRFPIICAQAAKKKNTEIIAIALKEEASPELEKYVSRIHWIGVGELEKLFQLLMQEKLSAVIMAGQVRHKLLFDKNIRLDKNMQDLLRNVSDKKTDSLIGAVALKLQGIGVRLLDSTIFLSDYIAENGTLTKNKPDKNILADIEFGRGIAKVLAGLDIGQTIVVKDKTVLAVESIEGTDEAIKRGAYYGKEGVIIVKVSKPNQDMRFDVPVIGPDTIELLKDVKAACLAIEAKKTLIIDKEKTLKLADDAGVIVIAI